MGVPDPPPAVARPLRHAPRSERRAKRCDLPADLTVSLRPIGVVRSPWTMREDAPRQGTVGEPVEAEIILRAGMQNSLQDLAGFSRVWILAWFHHSRGWKQQIVPPRDTRKRGLFATRSPDRPNPIGLTCAEIVSVYGVVLTIRGHDLLDGTPVLDLKPYIAAYDAFPGAAAGWVDALTAPGADHRMRSDPPNRRTRDD
jgi:tRNA-Thr(GGU) m(6)t(6)A37 methyltransferase TsaA